MTLSRDELRDRLKFDYRVAMRMPCRTMSLWAFRSSEDLKARRNWIQSEEDGGLAKHYLVEYKVRTLTGPGTYTDQTQVHFDLPANGNYPHSEPGCWVVSSPLPWSPHFKAGSPICIGEIWQEARGKILLGQLLVHVAKLLNFDEVARGGGYVGWNAQAIAYWKSTLKELPITPNLVYPVLPTDLTHGDETEGDAEQGFFTAKKSQPHQTHFQPRKKN